MTAADAEVRKKAVERFKAMLELSAEFGVDVRIARFRGLLRWAADRATGMQWFQAALDELLPVAERLGARIVLEPQMRFNTDFLNTVDETVAFIRGNGSKALVFEGDLYHMALEEKSVPAALARGHLSGLMTYV